MHLTITLFGSVGRIKTKSYKSWTSTTWGRFSDSETKRTCTRKTSRIPGMLSSYRKYSLWGIVELIADV